MYISKGNITRLMRGVYFLIVWCFSQTLYGVSLKQLATAEPILVNEIDVSSLKSNQLKIATPFAQPIILNKEQKELLKEKAILKVELVYTQFRTSPTFNQKQLNLNRLKELKKLAPFLFDFPLWDYELLEQTNGNSRAVCNEMFHGFIITFRPNSTTSMLSQEADYIEKLVANMIKQDSIKNDTVARKKMKFDIKTHYDLNLGYIHDTIWHSDTVKPPSPPDFFYNHRLYKDSTVINAFSRNNSWKNFIVITDVTGSMSPYSAQVFVWLKAQAENKKASHFVFFNDGDQKASSKKKPLETEGIYVAENKGVDEVIKIAAKCMRNGSGGGESMENDIEAVLKGIKHNTKASSIILVADNYEIMRDYKYLNKIKKPVHVILCGADRRINIQYLDLARSTKGSLHTKKSDLNNLHDIKEGKHFFVEEKEYMFENGRFHAVYESAKYQNKSVR